MRGMAYFGLSLAIYSQLEYMASDMQERVHTQHTARPPRPAAALATPIMRRRSPARVFPIPTGIQSR